MLRALVLTILVLARLAAAVGPDTTAVIIDGDDPASGAVARLWMRLRGVPEAHAIELRGLPDGQRMSLEQFRAQVLEPIEAALIERGLAERIALIAYGPGFPTAIDFPVAEGSPDFQRSPGSLTGLTFLAPMLDEPSTVFTGLRANPYAERQLRPGNEVEKAAGEDPRSKQAMKALVAKDYVQARELLAAIAETHPAPALLYNLACTEVLTGDPDAAERTLGRAIDAGWLEVHHSELDPDLATLRARPSWAGLVSRMHANHERVRPDTSEPFVPIRVDGQRIPHRLAILLADLGPRGLSQAEAEAQLSASVAADGTSPSGTIWFMASPDHRRTGPRRWAFASAASAIRDLGVAAEVRDGVLPPPDAAVAGATLATAHIDWPASGARMVAGAWCDHLTSFGGALDGGSDQTPLTVFLRAGAAGAGGAVTEPSNRSQKFPSAFVHLHRVRGLSLVEAVHRSMSGPYQYLVVGDPLSRPWPAR
jgi:hypothetical protein